MSQEKIPHLSFDEVVSYLDRWEKLGGTIRLSTHLKYDRAYRNVSIRDCRYVLTTGILCWPPEWDESYQNWVYDIGGHDLDDSWLRPIFTIDLENMRIIIITGKG